MDTQEERLRREERIRDYLFRKLSPEAAESFEVEYLASGELFEEMVASRLILQVLGKPKVEKRRLEDVTILHFTGAAALTIQSDEMEQLKQTLEQMDPKSDTKVLIDLSRVSRIDSSGLALLITWHTHAARNQGMVKLLNPGAKIRQMMRVTRLDSVLEAYDTERDALRSFGLDPETARS
ncbi:MAG: STAS domain-containing protein [Bryobacteraceae bacterium]|nr:STAS domain-containing protein [Bryobacteraceae bacterium]